jgi:hypothetical protein
MTYVVWKKNIGWLVCKLIAKSMLQKRQVKNIVEENYWRGDIEYGKGPEIHEE